MPGDGHEKLPSETLDGGWLQPERAKGQVAATVLAPSHVAAARRAV
jgi:hypothetical protein